MLIQAGHQVVFMSPVASAQRYVGALEQEGVECVYDRERRLFNWDAMAAFAGEGHYDVAVLVTYGIFNQHEYPLRKALPHCTLILDTVDLHSLRVRREAELLGGAERYAEADRVEKEEWAAICEADTVWVVTEREKELLAQKGIRSIGVVPTIHRPNSETAGWSGRSGVVFLGGYNHSPNVDGACWFVEAIWPKVSQSLPDVSLTLAGSNPSESILGLANDAAHVTVTGFVPDHRKLLLNARVAIAPLRYGAGMKGKLGEYLCCGVPCVTTALGVEGMGMKDAETVAIADSPEAFAEAVVRVYTDPETWQRMSDQGREFMRRYSPEAVAPMLVRAIEGAAREQRRRRGLWGRLSLGIRHRVRRIIMAKGTARKEG
jgi:glycosyltransferase involved in cell wall biosynthesis